MTFVMKKRAVVLVLACVALVAWVGRPAAASTDATISPDCSLYAVTLTVRVLLQDFNSPNLTINASKWPRLMREAKAARAAFTDPRLVPVRSQYHDLVRRLAVVGAKLDAGRRAAAYTTLKAAKPDLKAVLAAAKRGNVVCKSGSTVIPIG